MTALEIDPNYLPAWGAIQLASRTRFEEALRMIDRARKLDPLSVTVEIVHANIYFFAGRFAEAVPHYQTAIELEPRMPWTHMRLALCRAGMGEYEEALRGVEGVEPSLARSLDSTSVRAYLLGKLGQRDDALAAIREIHDRSRSEHVAWQHYAYAFAGVGDLDALYGLLSKAVIKDNLGRLMLVFDPAFEPIRRDPRFQAVLPAQATATRSA